MITENYIPRLPRPLKHLVGVFLVVLSIGYFTGIAFVENTTSLAPEGIVENYTGNEEDEEATIMKFRKSDREMLTILHTHILSMSLIFFILGFLVYGCPLPSSLKYFLMIEPLISVVLTFGGIYLVWLGYEWLTYLVMLSGALMTLSFVAAVGCILWALR